ncbi:MAG: ATP-dependent Clp protease proteolytic subunit [Bacteroidaceae bacterium]|nr:ATP-dependent Clp protease proteolytic subunit [Bacteroidaceae bacterium]
MTYNLYILDTIGYPISTAYVRQELAKCKDKPCEVYISSLGGDVNTALQIRQLFIEHGDVTAHLHGFVASAATIVATGAKQIKMGEFALFMIHKCSTWQDEWGQMNADNIAAAISRLTSAKNALDSIDHVIGSIYAQRTGQSVSTLAEMMKDETWLTAEDAKAQGFVDDIIPDEQPASLTNEQRQRIVAYGYPVPELADKQQAQQLGGWQKFAAMLENLFQNHVQRIADEALGCKSEGSENSDKPLNQTSTAMNKDFKAVMALLLIDAIATTDDGHLTLTAQQMQTINNRLAELAADKQVAEDALATANQQVATLTAQVEALQKQVSDLTTTNADLSTQITALQKSDGDETTHIEGETGSVDATHKTYAERARAGYDKIKSLIV